MWRHGALADCDARRDQRDFFGRDLLGCRMAMERLVLCIEVHEQLYPSPHRSSAACAGAFDSHAKSCSATAVFTHLQEYPQVSRAQKQLKHQQSVPAVGVN